MMIGKKGKRLTQNQPAPFCTCLLCGETIKVTVWRKHLVIQHSMQGVPRFRDYFEDMVKQQCRCKICTKLIAKQDWSKHLLKKHHIGRKIIFSDYFKINNQLKSINYTKSIERNNGCFARGKSPIKKDWRCGDILEGPPKVNIIYNALCTNRRKH